MWIVTWNGLFYTLAFFIVVTFVGICKELTEEIREGIRPMREKPHPRGRSAPERDIKWRRRKRT